MPAIQTSTRRTVNRITLKLQDNEAASPADLIVALRQLIQAGGVCTLEPLLPLVLSLDGKPYTLRDHFAFSTLFRTNMPQRLLVKSGRQVSKSTSLASSGVMLAGGINNFKELYVTPRYEQIRRFSNNFIRPFIEQSPIRNTLVGSGYNQSVLQRSFRNGSIMHFSFALLDADRLRGIAADIAVIDEVQDMDPDHLPIIWETTAYSPWSMVRYTGTPKTIDNTIHGLWLQSSQAEWFIRCSCGADSIPSQDFHIDKMIGPWREDISEQRPAILCHRCRKPINPRPPRGRWVHRHPERRFSFAGYHVPQIIMPLHCTRADKWAELLTKRDVLPPATFYNEVLGESVDEGQKLVTETELRAACTLSWHNNEDTPAPELMRMIRHYRTLVLAIDWGGGGEKEVSFTAIALLGLTPTGNVHVLWGKRLRTPNDHMVEAKEIIHWCRIFHPDIVAHDYSGAGSLRETVLVQCGFPLERIMAIDVKRAASGNLIRYVNSTPLHQRAHYVIDKARTLLYTCQAIKSKLCTFFQCDYIDEQRRGLIFDFLALMQEKRDSLYAGSIYTITRNILLSDDFAQTVNFGCVALWHSNDAWPNFANAARIANITNAQRRAFGDAEYGWEQDSELSSYLSMP